MTASIPSIKFSNVTTGYGDKVITRNIDASLLPGSFTCLIGPNGAGKSTLLRTLCHFQPPLSGEIGINGTDINHIPTRRLARQIGVVLTERPSAMNMTVYELVSLGRTPYTGFFGSLTPADKQVVDEAISCVGISELANRRVDSLSDGERQKAMIAKTLAQQTGIIILDEPTSFLDYPAKVNLMCMLRDIAHRQQKTVFITTHDIDLAMRIADNVWMLDRRHGLRIGAPEDLIYDGELQRYFGTDRLHFAPATGNPEIILPVAAEVHFAGDGSMMSKLAEQALRRVGLRAVAHEELPVKIEVKTHGDERPEIHVNGSPVADIATMLEVAKTLPPKQPQR